MMRTRLKDIAHDLNISPGLVSGVLNGRENVWASEETRRRIFESAKRLNYIPSLPVKAKPQSLNGRIELVFCRGSRKPASELASTVELLAAEAELNRLVFVVTGLGDLGSAVTYLEAQSSSRSDPIVLWGTQTELEMMGNALKVQAIPFLVCGETDGIEPSWAQASINFEEMIRGAVDHVRVQGHRTLAFLGSVDATQRGDLMRSTFANWTQSCLGKSVPADFIILGGSLQDYCQKISNLLGLPASERPTGFVVGGDSEGWLALEISLSAVGLKLGFRTSMVSASGLVDKPFHLLYGDALGYDLNDSSVFASSIGPLVRQLASKGVCLGKNRLTPRLSRIPSLHLPLQLDSSNSKVLS